MKVSMTMPTSEYFGIIEQNVGFELDVHEGAVHVTVWVHWIGWEVTPSWKSFMAKVSWGLAFFYFPVASLLRLILEIKDFLPLLTWFILQDNSRLDCFFGVRCG